MLRRVSKAGVQTLTQIGQYLVFGSRLSLYMLKTFAWADFMHAKNWH
jgi:hypothetical protein